MEPVRGGQQNGTLGEVELMGNLGRYQDIVIDAKRAGGVDSLIVAIERNAVADAAPRLLVIGAGCGALAVLAARSSARRYQQWKSTREAQAEDAKTQLRTDAESPLGLDADQPGTSDDKTDHEGESQ